MVLSPKIAFLWAHLVQAKFLGLKLFCMNGTWFQWVVLVLCEYCNFLPQAKTCM